MNLGSTSTADDVLDQRNLAGKRVLVTGVSSGVGVETARVLAAHGASVVGTARNLAKGAAALDAVGCKGNAELVELDLASFASVSACADLLLADAQPFDAIIANAGAQCGAGRGIMAEEPQNGRRAVLTITALAPFTGLLILPAFARCDAQLANLLAG